MWGCLHTDGTLPLGSRPAPVRCAAGSTSHTALTNVHARGYASTGYPIDVKQPDGGRLDPRPRNVRTLPVG